MTPEKLKSYGQMGLGGMLSDRYDQSGYAGQVGIDGIDVAQVHVQWIVDFGTQLKGNRRRGGREQYVDLLEDAVEVTANQGSYAPAFCIVRVVVAG